jgi:peroxiredoxin
MRNADCGLRADSRVAIMKSVAKTFFVSALIASLMCACGGREDQAPLTSHSAPDFRLADLNGRIYSLTDLKGRVVVLNFFATWCGPCRLEIPELVRLHQKFKDKGLEIVGVSLDQDGNAVLRPFIMRYGITYPIVLGTREVVVDYGGIQGIPTTFVIDHNGAVSDYFVGLQPSYMIENTVVKLLKQRG